MSKKDQKKELDALTKRLDQWESEETLARGFGQHVAEILQNKWPGNTNLWAAAIAQILISVEDDTGTRHGCRNLLLQWVLERFTGLLVMDAMPDIHDVYDNLKSLKYTANDRLIFNDLDNKAWWIPVDNKKVFVMQSQARLKLVIIDSNSIMDELHVRRLWYKYDEGRSAGWHKFQTLKWFREHDWKPTYGDCRDEGYVLSYKRMNFGKRKEHGTVDRGNHYEPQQFMDDIRWTQHALQEEQTMRLSKIHSKS